MGRVGMRKRVPMASDQACTRLWKSMGVLMQFTSAELVATSDTGVSHTGKYLRKLVAAGYLRVVTAKAQGVPGGHTVYQLIRNTGPHAPRFSKDGLIDPNLQPAKPLPGEEPVTIKRCEYDRLLACARACAGMQNPEAEMAALRGLVHDA